MEKTKIKWFLLLHVMMLVFAYADVLAKFAAGYELFSLPFFLLYGGMLLCLGIYALGWQQVLKHIPLTTAYANKAVVVVWGIVLGALIFGESISIRQLVGSAVIIAGVLLYIYSDGEGDAE